MWLVYLYVPSPTAVSSNSDMTVKPKPPVFIDRHTYMCVYR